MVLGKAIIERMAKWKPRLTINKDAFIQEKNENRINDRDPTTCLVPDNPI